MTPVDSTLSPPDPDPGGFSSALKHTLSNILLASPTASPPLAANPRPALARAVLSRGSRPAQPDRETRRREDDPLSMSAIIAEREVLPAPLDRHPPCPVARLWPGPGALPGQGHPSGSESRRFV